MTDNKQHYIPIVEPPRPSVTRVLKHWLRQQAIFAIESVAAFQVACRPARVKPAEILFLTAFDSGIATFAEPIARHNEAYARRHGYAFLAQRDGFDARIPQSWSKILFLRSQLSRYRWIFWCDADALVVDRRVSLETFLDRRADLIFGETVTPVLHLNCGCFFVQPTLFSRLFLRSIWRHARFFSAHAWFEQAAVNHVYRRFKLRRLKVVPNRLFNAFAGPCDYHPKAFYHDGDFIAHFAGQPDKSALLAEFEKKIVL